MVNLFWYEIIAISIMVLCCILLIYDFFSNIRFSIIQYRWGRKLIKGTFYLVDTNLSMLPFWTDTIIKGPGTRVLKIETYETWK